jgi:hypothetical protein
MRRLSMAAFISLALLLLGTAAEAVDLCFEDTLGQVYVAKALAMPTANNCKTFNGYVSGVTSTVTGNVCKTRNNNFFYFNLHSNIGTLSVRFVTFNLNASTLEGNGRLLNPDYGVGSLGSFSDFGIEKVTCPPGRFFGF